MSTITITRTVAAPADAAWRAWTDASELARWWWPQLPDTTYDWVPEEGSAYRIESAQAGIGVHGVFIRVEAPRLLACTWVWHSVDPGNQVEDTVEVSFEPEGTNKTVVSVRHTSAVHVAEGGAEQGWNDVMDRLVELS
jgi:uncharacterized protein YndB with AHSA1/START domain